MRRRPAGRPDGGEFAPGLEATDDDIEVQVRNFEIRDVRGRGSAKPPALDEDDVWAAVRAMPAGSRLASEAMRQRPGDAAQTAAHMAQDGRAGRPCLDAAPSGHG